MSLFLREARHPRLDFILENWERSSGKINLDDHTKISDIPDFLGIQSKFKDATIEKIEIDYLSPSRDILGAHAIRAVAKAYEALDGAKCCDDKKITSSAMLLAYNSSFFAAKSMCYLFGFTPADRDSQLTFDLFFKSPQEKTITIYRYPRWGHSEVWALAIRLIYTFKSGYDVERTFLRKAKLKHVSKPRNAYAYNDSKTSFFSDADTSDFPDFALKNSSEEFEKYIAICENFLKISNDIIRQSDMKNILLKHVSRRRRRLAA